MVAAPLYRLLADGNWPAQHAVMVSGEHARFLWVSTSVILVLAVATGVWLKPDRLFAVLRRLGRCLSAPGTMTFAVGLAVGSGALTLLFTIHGLEGKPPFVDGMAQLLHARYLAEGALAGPPLPRGEFWMFQNLVLTESAWLSQYPPGHVALLGLGFRLGAVWLVGAAMAGVMAFFTALAADRLLPDDRATARLGAALAAFSPFALFLAGTYMNHVSAAAFGALAVYCLTRTWSGGSAWAAAAGAAVGAVFMVRPFTGMLMAAVVAFGMVWRGPQGGTVTLRRYARLAAASVAGALPMAVALALYNAHFFGAPTRFGYIVAQGSRHGLGFHPDPWGQMYGLAQAIGYTSSDLIALSRFLLETPLPVVPIVGAYLVAARPLDPGRRVIAAWGLLPVLGNFFYWHHDLVMGPRMLAEAAPAWALLAAVAGVGLVRQAPPDLRVGRAVFHPRTGLAIGLLIALVVGLGYFAPQRALAYAGDWQRFARVEVAPQSEPTLVFVHEAWSNRLGARLAGRGLRQDSIVRLLGTVPLCLLHAQLGGWVGEGSRLPAEQRSDIEVECQREHRADRFGTAHLPPLLWQGDLPGLAAGSRPMFVRDLGPEQNQWLLERFPQRRPLVFAPLSPAADAELIPYERGMQVLWGD